VSLLPVAGEDGTLQRRLTARPYRGNVRAKTGYVSGVGALSGYARTRGGIEVAFSILINDTVNPPGTYSMRETLDSICRAIVDCAE
jgi:D-alanyl-D-alanine carboxypeptidase/D-alanyl-D-alanine-endopeptidase (penicillin-binding protein 4)